MVKRISIALLVVLCLVVHIQCTPAVLNDITNGIHKILAVIPTVSLMNFDVETTVRDRITMAAEVVNIVKSNSTSTYVELVTDLVKSDVSYTTHALVYTPEEGYIATDPNTYLTATLVFMPAVVVLVLFIALCCCAVCCCCTACCPVASLIPNPCPVSAVASPLQALVSCLTVLVLGGTLVALLLGAVTLGWAGQDLADAIGSDISKTFYSRWHDIYTDVWGKLPTDLPPIIDEYMHPWKVLDTLDPAMADLTTMLTFKTAIQGHTTAVNAAVVTLGNLIDNVDNTKTTTQTAIQAIPGYGGASFTMTIPTKPAVDTTPFGDAVTKMDTIADTKDNMLSQLDEMTYKAEIPQVGDMLQFFLPRAPKSIIEATPVVGGYYGTVESSVDMIDSFFTGLPAAVTDIVSGSIVARGVAGVGAAVLIVAAGLLCCCGVSLATCFRCCACVVPIPGWVMALPLGPVRVRGELCSAPCLMAQACCMMVLATAVLSAGLPFLKAGSDVCYDWTPAVTRLTQAALDAPLIEEKVNVGLGKNVTLTLGTTNVLSDLLQCSGKAATDIVSPAYLNSTGLLDLLPTSILDVLPSMTGHATLSGYITTADFATPVEAKARSFIGALVDIQSELDSAIGQIVPGQADIDTMLARDFRTEMGYDAVTAQLTDAVTKVGDIANMGWDQAAMTTALGDLNSEVSSMLAAFDGIGCPAGDPACACLAIRGAYVATTWDATPGDDTTYIVNLDKTTDFTGCLETATGNPTPVALTDALAELENAESVRRLIGGAQEDLIGPGGTTGFLGQLQTALDGLLLELETNLKATVGNVKTSLDAAHTKLVALDGATMLDPLYTNVTAAVTSFQTTATGYTTTMDAALDCTVVGEVGAAVGTLLCDTPQVWGVAVAIGLTMYIALLGCQCFVAGASLPLSFSKKPKKVKKSRRRQAPQAIAGTDVDGDVLPGGDAMVPVRTDDVIIDSEEADSEEADEGDAPLLPNETGTPPRPVALPPMLASERPALPPIGGEN